MSCEDCEALRSRLEAREKDLAEAQKENAGLIAEIARLRELTFSLAAQITGSVP